MTVSISQKQDHKIEEYVQIYRDKKFQDLKQQIKLFEEYVQIYREKHSLLVKIAATIQPLFQELMEEYQNLDKQLDVISEQVPEVSSESCLYNDLQQERQRAGQEWGHVYCVLMVLDILASS